MGIFKVESVKFETPFMSERATLFLSSIGLLGEYCPTSRKKYSCAETIGCMHLELPGGHSNSPRNIGASNRDDAFYRYKMPRMVTKIEGRGNGIKTNVVNMVEIAKALGRPASYTTKYFGCELGAQSKFDEKTGTSLVNGAHDTAKLAGLLENFIKKYVQCYGCGNPETEIIITKTQMITMKCAACGFISDVDMRDKITTFILKNPPEQKKGSKDKKAMRRAEKERLKEGEAADEEQKKLKKDSVKKKSTSGNSKETVTKVPSKKKNNGSDDDHSPVPIHASGKDEVVDDDDDDDDVQWQTDTSLEAAKQRIQEQLSAVTADMVMLSTEETTSSKKPSEHEKSSINGNKNGNGVSPHVALVNEIKDYLKKGSSAANLKSFLESLSGTPQEIVNALVEALFDGVGKGFSKEVMKKKNFLAAAVALEGSQIALLRAIESFCLNTSSEAAKEVALVLKSLYDSNLIEEEFVLEWYQRGVVGANKSSPIWNHVKPFIEWLQNAESETEEE
ncbi:Eukaryotic translation initiation factor 5, partial [Cucurbita argyrosperma subsp. argyrosperma]